MPRVYYNKLIRDLISEKIKKNGEELGIRKIVDDQEFEQELLKKVNEEAQSLSRVRSKEEFLDEYADLMEVLETLLKNFGFSEKEIKKAREENRKRKGGFAKRIFLHWSSDGKYKSNETPQGVKRKKK